jgi:hypothetical protein
MNAVRSEAELTCSSIPLLVAICWSCATSAGSGLTAATQIGTRLVVPLPATLRNVEASAAMSCAAA